MNNETHETIADIVTEMRKRAEEVYVGQDGYPESWKDQMDYGEIYELADRIEVAHKCELEAIIEKSSINGNEAAFEAIIDKIDEWHANGEMEHWQYSELFDIADNALAYPSRNCDCHLAKNLIGAVMLYCSKNPELPPMVEWNAIQYLEFCKWLFAEDKED